ncbi:MAG: ABC transporter permease [Trueperaceae bacterium]|nr:ABC transporter permease [Trueperaceae bacterium]
MLTFLLRRLVATLPALLGVTFFSFMLLYLAPGDPTSIILGMEWSPERAAQLRTDLGLDLPIVVQYLSWLGRVAQGDLGLAYVSREPVLKMLIDRLPDTLALSAGAMLCAVLVAIPLGSVSALRKDSWVDTASRVVAVLGISMPVFWFGMLLILLFAVVLRILPPGGGIDQYGAKALILPSVALGMSLAALLTRITRASMVEVLQLDHIRTAKAKGLKQWHIVFKHALKNALIPVVTVLGLQSGYLLSGAVLTETVFSLPGVGRLLYTSILNRDYLVLQGATLFVCLAMVAINLVVDFVYAAIDPRIRYA